MVRRHGETVAFRGTRTALQLVAFYADCRHDVRPVRSGARVALTSNLLARGKASPAPPADPRMLNALTRALRRHFDAPASAPDRLVYLLDQEYTARGRRWDLLKGADAKRAALLQAAAGRLDCEIVLAQADVLEIWSCEDEYEPMMYRRRWRSSYRTRDDWEDELDDLYDDDSDDAGDGDTPTLMELIDSEIEQLDRTGRSQDGFHLVGGDSRGALLHASVERDAAFSERARRLHGQLGEHRRPVVPQSRCRSLASRPDVRHLREDIGIVGGEGRRPYAQTWRRVGGAAESRESVAVLGRRGSGRDRAAGP